MEPTPLTPERVSELLAELFATAAGTGRLRVAIDGAEAAGTESLAASVVERLRDSGTPAAVVHARDFLRPSSVRLEQGRSDPDSFYSGWLDASALEREVLRPLATDGSGRWLPTLRDAVTDRATRADYVSAPASMVMLVDGPLLLAQPLTFDLRVHIHLGEGALTRRTPPDRRWTLSAYARYATEAAPLVNADVVIRADDPRRPALELR